VCLECAESVRYLPLPQELVMARLQIYLRPFMVYHVSRGERARADGGHGGRQAKRPNSQRRAQTAKMTRRLWSTTWRRTSSTSQCSGRSRQSS
jgi:hypothetical protein